MTHIIFVEPTIEDYKKKNTWLSEQLAKALVKISELERTCDDLEELTWKLENIIRSMNNEKK